jgi:hypothetical protein
VYDNGGVGWFLDASGQMSLRIDGVTSDSSSTMADVVFSHFTGEGTSMGVSAFGDNLIVNTRLNAGATISNGNATDTRMRFSISSSGESGWSVPGSGYLGLKFDDGTTVNYGWAEISIPGGFPGVLKVERFAVEGTPDTSIIAGAIPEPSTLVFLLAGATGLYYIRNRKKNAAA